MASPFILRNITYGVLGLLFPWGVTHQLGVLLDISKRLGQEPNALLYVYLAVLFCVGVLAVIGHSLSPERRRN